MKTSVLVLVFVVIVAVYILFEIQAKETRYLCQTHTNLPHHAPLYKAMREVDAILEAHDIPYWICGGSALGAIRHGAIIPWDDDIDIVVPIAFQQQLRSIPWSTYNFRWENVNVCDKLFQGNVFIDVFYVEKANGMAGNRWIHSNAKARSLWPHDWFVHEQVFPLQTVKLGPIQVKAPNDMHSYCFRGYGPNCLKQGKIQPLHFWNKFYAWTWSINPFATRTFEL